VASENVYWRYRRGLTRLNRLSLSFLARPVTSMYGYAPWSRVSSAEDLPMGAARQMGDWVRSSGGVLDDPTMPTERYHSFQAPVLAYSIDDDPEGTKPSVDLMMSAYPNVERRHITPAEAGLTSLGHFGYFKPSAQPLWVEAIDWLTLQPAGSTRGPCTPTREPRRAASHGATTPQIVAS
jgi:predicted alpha/beta hydrolase